MGCCGGGSKSPVRSPDPIPDPDPAPSSDPVPASIPDPVPDQLPALSPAQAWYTALPPTLSEEYELRNAGKGGFFETNVKRHAVLEKATGAKFTADFYYFKDEEGLETAMAIDELYKRTNHPNLPKLEKVFQGEKCVIFIRTKCEGGDLLGEIIRKEALNERIAADYTQQILLGLQHIHSHRVLHRNIKPESILFADKAHSQIILHPSFYLSAVGEFEDQEKPCGTPMYVSPELLRYRKYGPANDVWAVGVVVFIMLCGYPPFQGNSDTDTIVAIKQNRHEFVDTYWGHVSSRAKSFVNKMLKKNPADRMTIEEALKHSWLTR